MSDNPLIPISDEQAKLAKEIVGAGREAGGYFADVLGDLPKDLVGLLAGDRVKVWREENLRKIWAKAKQRLEALGIEPEPNPKLTIPMVEAAANETSDELRDLWARLLAAAMNPNKAHQVRLRFSQVLKQLDPVDPSVLTQLRNAAATGVWLNRNGQREIATKLSLSEDQ